MEAHGRAAYCQDRAGPPIRVVNLPGPPRCPKQCRLLQAAGTAGRRPPHALTTLVFSPAQASIRHGRRC